MKLRSKLAVALLGLSVLPLAVVTALSYRASRDAFRQAVEAEAAKTAAQMGQRMDAVRYELARDLQFPRPPAGGAAAAVPGSERWAADLERQLREHAGLVRRVEIRPKVGAPGAGRGTDGFVIDLSRLGMQLAQSAMTPEERAEVKAEFEAQLAQAQREITAAVRQAAEQRHEGRQQQRERQRAPREQLAQQGEALRQLGEIMPPVPPAAGVEGAPGVPGVQVSPDVPATPATPAAPAAPAAPPAGSPVAPEAVAPEPPDPETIEIPVREDGAVVAQMAAQLDLSRVLDRVFQITRDDERAMPFAVDAKGRVFGRTAQQTAALQKLEVARLASAAGQGAPLRVFREDHVIVMRREPNGIAFGVARPVGESLAEIRNAAGRNLALGLLVIAVALFGILPLSRRMTRPIGTLTDGARRIAAGDLDTQVVVRGRDEIAELATTFNGMARDLQTQRRALVEQERLRRELELCRQIQNEMLPKVPLHSGLTEVRGVSIPAREVGGDFFNYFAQGDGGIALVVGDVSGKGVGAALLMANLQATLKARLLPGADLAGLAADLDREVEASTPSEVYLTLFFGVLDPATGRLRYVNAGHNTQYAVRAGGGLDALRSSGLPLGLFSGRGYEEREITLAPGDVLFFYTDGIVEVADARGDLFGEARLEAVLGRAHGRGVEDVLAQVEGEVRAFRGAVEPNDDATMMVLRFG